jgi:hypothetical protein
MISVVIPLKNGIQKRDGVGESFILTSELIAFISKVNDGVFFDDAHTPTLASGSTGSPHRLPLTGEGK